MKEMKNTEKTGTFEITREEVYKETRRVRLTPKSQHGRNRVREQGDTWIVMNETSIMNTVKHRNCSGPFILCEKDGNIRWVSTTDDPDFVVEEV